MSRCGMFTVNGYRFIIGYGTFKSTMWILTSTGAAFMIQKILNFNICMFHIILKSFN